MNLPFFVAQEKEFFAKNGLKVQLEQFQDGLQINESVFAGRLDGGGYVALDNIFSAQAASSERGVKIFSFVLEPESKPVIGLIYSNELDINSLDDLSGKKIGYFPPTPPVKLWISEILKKNNVDMEQVDLIPSSPTNIVSALQTKQVDAIFTIEPFTTIAVKQDIGKLFNENESLIAENLGITPFPIAGVIISNDFAENYETLTKSLIDSLDEAVEYIRNNPEDARNILGTYLPEQQRSIIPSINRDSYWKSSEVELENIQKYHDFLLQKQVLLQPLNLNELLLTGK